MNYQEPAPTERQLQVLGRFMAANSLSLKKMTAPRLMETPAMLETMARHGWLDREAVRGGDAPVSGYLYSLSMRGRSLVIAHRAKQSKSRRGKYRD